MFLFHILLFICISAFDPLLPAVGLGSHIPHVFFIREGCLRTVGLETKSCSPGSCFKIQNCEWSTIGVSWQQVCSLELAGAQNSSASKNTDA